MVQSIVRNAVRGGSTADPDVLSAQYALRYFASYLVRPKGQRLNIPQGMQQISKALSDRLACDVLELNAPVWRVSPPEEGCYGLEVEMPSNGITTFRASHVVFAIPVPGIAELAPWFPAWKLDAIEKVQTNPTVTLAIVLDSASKANWDDIFLITAADAHFNTVLQTRASADQVPSQRERTHFNCYLSADPETAAPGDDAATTSAWLEAFFRILPDARGRVLGTRLARWPRCFAYPAPGREKVLDQVQAPVDSAHLAGDFTSVTAGSHGALQEDGRAAREMLQASARS
ncbi:hypothetical protein MPLDJ20_20214 [Mesorhizobium plurifarium]|uniref:Amine oxidase domain-containing protein n=1 Tax=Mesorhizobium plurifarium TaxID=69974 RepID=A0A090F1V3_MESPL|nr:hypothetical protein MPLDJ20_20214 [Mesorhizobium plurifarium]